jgi:phosphatidylethanolamine/phosphatidyl-N-methylethanolamine N-methyltransferase
MKSLDLDRNVVKTADARWAPIHDAVCGPVMVEGRRAASNDAILVERRKVAPLGIHTAVCFERVMPSAA